MKRVLILIGSLFVIGFIIYWAVGGTRRQTEATLKAKSHRGVPVETVSLTRGSLDRQLSLTGTIRPEATVEVFSKASGILEKISVQQGDRVQKDRIIATVEREEREAQFQEVRAALDVLEARWTQMKTGARPEEIAQAEELVREERARWENSVANYKRLKSLRERNVISTQHLDEARLQVTLSEAGLNAAREKLTLLKKGARKEDREALLAQIRQAKAALRLAQTRLDNTTIRAPIGGIIAKRYLDQGAFVSPATEIVRIVSMDTVKVVVQVVERVLAELRPGATAEIRVDAYPGQAFTGTVFCISPTLDPESRTADVEIKVDNRDHQLKPGMFARVSIVIQSRSGVLLLPKDSLLNVEGTTRVFVNDHGSASIREVHLGLIGERHVEVLSGLREGDEVIMAGHYELRDGMPVKVIRRHGSP